MPNNHFITAGRYILIEYLKDPSTFEKRITRNRVDLAEEEGPRSKNVSGRLKAKIEQIISRRSEWLTICNGRLCERIQWQPENLGNELPIYWKNYFGLDESTSLYEGLEIHWIEVVLYDLIGRAFADWLKSLL